MGYAWQDLIDRPAELGSATLFEARLVVSLRIAIFAHKTGADPAPHVAARLGSVALSNQLSLVLEAMGQAWPEPFSVSRPCCGRMSPDEAMFVGMLRSAMRGNRAAFDRQTREMIAEDARTLIYNLMWQIGKMVPAAPDDRVQHRHSQ
ncbi:hypothetical protein [Blastomonas aquatica]|uniref:Addiction module antidote protein n=1 Tax=Blastomonas aquatica TaxID=1510276 RepID=A0ABQ1JG30_9SPHN|nr:hypothetical protein [Blastomonas aquatica]GGB66304.1 hypothetical protein GCM10010833_21840 [Blastomonas aquatica]